ncbi:MAG: flagellar hook-associated protein FlgK [Lachnospiraceae bacterium]|nr:flagellar hook-associated protein FlgK [Lachnospiraceae bacterium]
MPSTFFGLNISASGLRAANAALNTTANNVSNVQTKGYSRQTVTQTAADPMRVYASYGSVGAGVDTKSIDRVRESFYDDKYRDNETRLGEQDKKIYYCKVIEDYFTDDKVSGFNTIFTNILNDLQEVTKTPDLESTKKMFIEQTSSLTDFFNNMYGNLQKMQSDVNQEMKVCVDDINSMARELASLNKQINVIELTGAKANELRDKRDVIVDKLSNLIAIDTKELPVYDINGNDTGATRYVVRLVGGQTLVDQNEARQIGYTAREDDDKVNGSDATGLFDFYWEDTKMSFAINNPLLGGQLQGLAEMRDGNNGEYFTGTAVEVDPSAGDKPWEVTVAGSGVDLKNCTLAEGGTMNLGNTNFHFTSWSYDESTGNYTFEIDPEDPNLPLLSSKAGKDVRIGSRVDYQGVPYYMQQMNNWVRDFAETVNSIFTDGVTSDNKDAGILLTGSIPTGGEYSEKELTEPDETGVYKGTNKGYYSLNAGNFRVADALLKDATLLGTRADADEGVSECTNVKKLIERITTTDMEGSMKYRGGTAGTFLATILGDSALNMSNASTFQSNYESIQNTIENQRTSISGVDEDEEALRMVQFQRSYTLSSKMLSTFTEIYDRLILETGV